jgi:hypothetical protein
MRRAENQSGKQVAAALFFANMLGMGCLRDEQAKGRAGSFSRTFVNRNLP